MQSNRRASEARPPPTNLISSIRIVVTQRENGLFNPITSKLAIERRFEEIA
jgi:hypothetical protein